MSEDAELSRMPLSQRLGFHLRALAGNFFKQSMPLIVVMCLLGGISVLLPESSVVLVPAQPYRGIVIKTHEPEGYLECAQPEGFGSAVSLALAEKSGSAKFADHGELKVHERYERVEGKPYPCKPGFDAYRLEKIKAPTAVTQQ